MAGRLRWLIGVDAAVAVSAPVADAHLAGHWPLQVGAAFVGVWTFFMVWAIQHGVRDARRNRTAVRDAIAAAFVTTYLLVVGWTMFSRLTADEHAESLDPLAQTLLSHFTYLTAIVVAAHMGAGAVEAIGDQRAKQRHDVDGDDSSTTADGS